MANKVLRHGIVLLTIFCLALQTNAGDTPAIITVDCTTNAECTTAAANSMCDTTAKKCKCAAGYTVNPDNNAACVMILGMDCTEQNAATKCTVDKSGCISGKCQCMSRYKMSGAMCEKILDMTCSLPADCTGLANSVCDNMKKCKCATNYKPTDDYACKKDNGQSCTMNSECWTGYCKDEDDSKTCAEENSAQSVMLSAGMMIMSLIVIAFQRFL